jgi:cold shock CspA family protein
MPQTFENYEDESLPLMRGKVRKLKEGFGFISGDDGRDYFFHWTALQRTTKSFQELAILDRVEGSVVESTEGRGPRLIEIRVIDDRPTSHPKHDPNLPPPLNTTGE